MILGGAAVRIGYLTALMSPGSGWRPNLLLDFAPPDTQRTLLGLSVPGTLGRSRMQRNESGVLDQLLGCGVLSLKSQYGATAQCQHCGVRAWQT